MINNITVNLCKQISSDLSKIGDSLYHNAEQLDSEQLVSLKEKFKDTTKALLNCASSSEIRSNNVEEHCRKRKIDLEELEIALMEKDTNKIEDFLKKKGNNLILYQEGHGNGKDSAKKLNDEIDTYFKNSINDINSKISTSLPTYTPSIRQSVEWRELDRVMLIIDKEPEDDDLVVVASNEFTENQTKCPYTGSTMTIPLKNTSANACTHRVSQEGFDAMIKNGYNGVARCPVGGCNRQWYRKQVAIDFELKKKIEEFLQGSSF